MQIKLKNFQLVPAINFLSGLSLKGKASRARMKLVNRLEEKRKEVAEEVNAVEHEKGSSQHDTEVTEILGESSTIDLTEYADKMAVLVDALENYDGVLTGQEAGVHDLLLDELEDNMETEAPQFEVVQDGE